MTRVSSSAEGFPAVAGALAGADFFAISAEINPLPVTRQTRSAWHQRGLHGLERSASILTFNSFALFVSSAARARNSRLVRTNSTTNSRSLGVGGARLLLFGMRRHPTGRKQSGERQIQNMPIRA